MSERTLVLVKPDGVARGLVGEVLGRLERKGYRFVAAGAAHARPRDREEHYAEHAGKPFFGELVDFITGGPLVAAVAEGPEVIESWRTLMGATDPVKAAPGHDPRRLRDADRREPRARLGLAGVRRPRDRALLPRAVTFLMPRSVAGRFVRAQGFWGAGQGRYHGRTRSLTPTPGRPALPHDEQHVVPRPRHGRRPRHGEHAGLCPRPRHRPQRALRRGDQHQHRRDPRRRHRGQADDRAHARQHRRDPAR